MVKRKRRAKPEEGEQDGFFIQSQYNNLVLSVNPDNEEVNIWNKNTSINSAYQLWKLDAQGYIQSKANGKVLDIDGADTERGASIILWKKLPGSKPQQRWTLTSDGHLESALNEFCIDIYDEDKAPGSNVVTWPKRCHAWQKWRFVSCQGTDSGVCSSGGGSSSGASAAPAPPVASADTTLEHIQQEWGDINTAEVKRGTGTCQVCFADDTPVFCMTANCQHTFCKSCISQYMDTSLSSGSFPLRCPQCRADALPDDRGIVTRSILKGMVKRKILKQPKAERILLNQVRNVGDEASINHAYCISKPCPNCALLIVHYRQHGCHHIAPGGGCSGCCHHFCFICLHDSGTQWTGCPNGCPPFCARNCKFCADCPDCEPGNSCDACSGNCPSCAP